MTRSLRGVARASAFACFAPGAGSAAAATAGLLALVPAAVVPAVVGAQQPAATGVITGRVVERGSNAPLAAAQVFVVGATPRGAVTSDSGTYRITGVPAGTVTLRVRRLGYEAGSQTVTVAAGQTVRADFTVGRAVTTTLEQVTVTATGEQQRRREQGNSVAIIQALPQERLANAQNFSQAISAQAPGVQVLQSGGTTGTGSRVRIRGANSFSLSNEPLLIIDGIRVNSDAQNSTIGIGGQSPSRLNDINPDDIDRIEVLKGPAAAGLFGTQAANGVVQIFTKQGQAGRPRWNVFADGGNVYDFSTYQPNYGAYYTLNGNATRGCVLAAPAGRSVNAGNCVQDSVVTFSPLEDPITTPFRTGARGQLGANVSGGTERATYYLAADQENESGVYRTNSLDRTNLRANVRANFSSQLDATVSAGYLNSDLRLPENDNNFLGYISNGLAGFAQPTRGDQGYDPIGPGQIDRIENRQDADRLIGSLQANWRPLSWLRLTTATGLDVLNRADTKLFPVGGVTLTQDYADGQRFANRFRTSTYTSNVSAAASFAPREGVTSTTTLSYQYQRDFTTGTFAAGYVLTAGNETLAGASTRFQVGESYLDNRLSGALLSQQFGFNDRVFLSAGIRGDDNSAFGRNFQTAYYPTASASWIVSEEPFFPRPRWLSSLQLRGAYGQAGLRPGNRDAQVYFNATPVRVDSAEAAGVSLGGIGDPNLKPERTTEFEGGFVVAALNNRVSLDATYYSRRSRDALLARRTAPSAGVTSSILANIGSLKNAGVELQLNTRPLDRPNLVWNVNVNYSDNRDRVVTLGTDASGNEIPPIIFGLSSTQRQVTGYPIGGYWAVPVVGYGSSNGNGIIDQVTYGDNAVFLGRAQPARLLSVNTDLTVYRNVRLSALVDYRGGFYQFNGTEEFRCAIGRCRGLYDVTATPFEQARAYATRFDGVQGGFVEKGDFVKVREVALTLTAPDRVARLARVRGASLTLAGQNLGLFTDYTGQDPESNGAGQANFSQFDFLTQPQTRRFNARINLSF